ncbi:MAG: DUF5694 domain-containing protein [Bacteroidota bacterium]
MLLRFSLLTVLVSSSVLAQSPFPELPAPPEKPPVEVMLVGVFHFAQTDTTVFDALDSQRQAEIRDFVGQLAAFEPTQVMVERQAYFWQDRIDSTYAEYRAGRFALPRNEVYQLGYRLADVAGLERVWAIDNAGFWLGDTLRATAEAMDQTALLDGTAPFTHPSPWSMVSRDSLFGEATVGEFLHWMSSPEYQALMYDGYVNRFVRVGMDTPAPPYRANRTGADLLGEWVRRNIKIYRHILERVDYAAGERVVVFIGADHVAPIRQFMEANYNVRMVEVADYVGT